MGTKNDPGAFDCLAKAHDDEPYFTLLGRDHTAPLLIRLWALLRQREVSRTEIAEDEKQIAEALAVADKMAAWLHRIGKDRVAGEDLLIAATVHLSEHPEDYDGPCLCALCQSYGGE